MENYYKILQVDKDASSEIIDKAYKLLVKKYHPDLQTDEEKRIAEEKIKKINEAYDIISDKSKREEYNKQLPEKTLSIDEYNSLINENQTLKDELTFVREKLTNISNVYSNFNNNYQSYNNNNYQNYNGNNFNNNTRNVYRNVFNHRTFGSRLKGFIKKLIGILIILLIGYFIIKIPAVSNILSSLKNINPSTLAIIVVVILILFNKLK